MSDTRDRADKTLERAKKESANWRYRDLAADNVALNEVCAKISAATALHSIPDPEFAWTIAIAVHLDHARESAKKMWTAARNVASRRAREPIKSLERLKAWLEHEQTHRETEHGLIYAERIPVSILPQVEELLGWARGRERALQELAFADEASGAWSVPQGAAVEFLHAMVGLSHGEIALFWAFIDAGGANTLGKGAPVAFPNALDRDDMTAVERRMITCLSDYRRDKTPEQLHRIFQRMIEDGEPT